MCFRCENSRGMCGARTAICSRIGSLKRSCGKAAFDTLETDFSQPPPPPCPSFLVSSVTQFLSSFCFYALLYLCFLLIVHMRYAFALSRYCDVLIKA